MKRISAFIAGLIGGRSRLAAGLAIAGLGLALAALLRTAQPVWSPPEGFDAYSYITMAGQPFERAHLPSHHLQRPFPTLLVRALADVTGVDVRTGFRILANTGFVLLAGLTAFLLWRFRRDALMAVAMTLLLLTSNWILRYNLNVFYQLCDLFTYVFVILFGWALLTRRYLPFWVAAIPAIFTRQNLIVAVMLGTIPFLWREGLVGWRTTGPARRASIRRLAGYGLGWMAHAALIAVLFRVTDGGSGVARHLNLDLRFVGVMLRDLLYLTLPFTFVFLRNAGALRAWWGDLFPLLVYAAVTVYQPYSFFADTGHDNALRLAMQGAWVFNLLGAVLILAAVPPGAGLLRRSLVLAYPALWVLLVVVERTLLIRGFQSGWLLELLRLLPALALAWAVGEAPAVSRPAGSPQGEGEPVVGKEHA